MAIVSNNSYESNNQEQAGVMVNFAKVFGYMGLGLLITAGVALGFGFLFMNIAPSMGGLDSKQFQDLMVGMIIGASCLQIILSIVISVVFLKGKHTIAVPAIIYCITMGFLCSTFIIFLPWNLLAMAFGVTSLIFILMAIIVLFTKANFNIFGVIGCGILVGCGLISLINMIIIWTTGQVNALYWIVSFACFGAVLLITIYDVYNIKKICEKGTMTKSLALYCAFTIYVDFMYIFIKICYYLALASGKR